MCLFSSSPAWSVLHHDFPPIPRSLPSQLPLPTPLAMDAAYDHIQQETLPKEEDVAPKEEGAASPTLNAEFQEAWGAVASSPWAARLGGLWGSVRKTVCF